MNRRTGDRARVLSELAGGCLRAAVLLEAGVHPREALDAVAPPAAVTLGGGVSRARVGRVRASARKLGDPRDALAAALAVAARSGAPLASTLRALSDSLTSLADAAREVEAAAVGPRLTTRVVAALPLAGVGISSALGFDVLGGLVGSPLGLVSLIAGTALSALGVLWSRRLVSRALPQPEIAGLVLDLTAIALLGGLPTLAATELAAAEARSRGLDLGGEDRALEIVAFSRRSGAAVVPLLRGEATLVRREQAATARERAERLSVTLLIPLGVCVLPAFVLVGVGPALLAVVSSTVVSA